jgi:FtsP/CotA-like multicopper oxidase with cupredoxin domain
VGAAVLIAVLAFVLLQPEDEDSSEQQAPATTTVTEQSGGQTAPDEPTTTEEQTTTVEVQAARIRVQGGQPVGGVREIEVKKDDNVRLTVTADAPEHVHVHGYDLFADVAPGQAAGFRFRAANEGVFEIELEDSHVQIAELRVEP